MLILLTVIFSIYAFTLWALWGTSARTELGQRPFLMTMVVLAWIALSVGVWFALVIMTRILFEKGRAVWIENDILIYAHQWNLAAACKNITDVVSGKSGRSNRLCVFLQMQGGTTKTIPTTLLVEPADAVASRIREYLSAVR
jgi:hypothetical protein